MRCTCAEWWADWKSRAKRRKTVLPRQLPIDPDPKLTMSAFREQPASHILICKLKDNSTCRAVSCQVRPSRLLHVIWWQKKRTPHVLFLFFIIFIFIAHLWVCRMCVRVRVCVLCCVILSLQNRRVGRCYSNVAAICSRCCFNCSAHDLIYSMAHGSWLMAHGPWLPRFQLDSSASRL